MIKMLNLEFSEDLAHFRRPGAVAACLQDLLDRQGFGVPLTAQEREEAEGLVKLGGTPHAHATRGNRTRQARKIHRGGRRERRGAEVSGKKSRVAEFKKLR